MAFSYLYVLRYKEANEIPIEECGPYVYLSSSNLTLFYLDEWTKESAVWTGIGKTTTTTLDDALTDPSSMGITLVGHLSKQHAVSMNLRCVYLSFTKL
jgi:hypothetical protein